MTALIDVFNAGLSQVGASPINVSELTTPVTPNGTIISRDGTKWVQDVMRAVDWACLTARMRLLNNGSVTMTLSSAAVGTNVTATPSSAYFNARDVGRYLYEVGNGLSGVFQVLSLAGSPLVATGSVTVAFAGTSLAAQGWTLKPLSHWKSAYLLPSDCLKFRGIVDQNGWYSPFHYRRSGGSPIQWDVEGQQVLTDAVDATEPNRNPGSMYPVGAYTYYEASPDNWDVLLLDAIEAKVAAELAWPVTKDRALVQAKVSLFQQKIVEAEGATRSERQRHGYPSTVLIDCRR